MTNSELTAVGHDQSTVARASAYARPAHVDDVASIRDGFVRGVLAPVSVRPDIAASWHRSRDLFDVSTRLSIAPEAEHSTRLTLDDTALLVELAGRAATRELDAEAAETVIALCDGRGRVVGTWGGGAVLRQARRHHLTPRSCWSERAIGTNALGLALKTQGMVSVSGPEHWCDELADWQCAAIAVRDSAIGRPLAAIMVASTGPLPAAAADWLIEITSAPWPSTRMRLVDPVTAPEPTPIGRSWPHSTAGPVGEDAPAGLCRSCRGGSDDPDEGPEDDTDDDLLRAEPDRPALARNVVGVKNHRHVLVSADEIALAEVAGRSVWLVTDLGRLRCATDGLERLERKLTGHSFMRVHRRFLVNLARVREVERKDGGELGLMIERGPFAIPVSRRRAPAVARALGI